MEKAPAVRVPKSRGEETRRALLEAGLLRTDLKVRREGTDLLLPVAPGAGESPAGPVEEAAFERAVRPPPPYESLLAGELPPELHALLPTSYDVIGDVVVVKLPEALLPHRARIGRALLDSVRSARTVAVDAGVEGEFRVRRLEVVAGRAGTETTHVEHGVRLRVDPATTYFSPRLATERRRVADLVREGERVVDLFAGVGPFALVIAKHARPARVDAVDLNPAAHGRLVENVRLNRAGDVVFPHLADAREWAAARPGVADRVIMNLPHGAHAFLDSALSLIPDRGGTIHHHAIRSEEALPRHLEELVSLAARAGRRARVVNVREVRTYSPQERHFAIDLEIGPEAVTRTEDRPRPGIDPLP